MPTTTPTLWGAAFTVYGAGDGSGFQIGATSNGGFAVLYTTPNGSESVATGRYFSGAGAAVGGNFLSAISDFNVGFLDASTRPEGGLAIGLTRIDSATDSDPVIGVSTGPGNFTFTDVNSAASLDFAQEIGTTATGYTIMYQQPNGLFFQKYDQSVTAATQFFSQIGLGTYSSIQATAVLPNGNMVVMWEVPDPVDNLFESLYLGVFSSLGGRVINDQFITRYSIFADIAPNLEVLNNGSFLRSVSSSPDSPFGAFVIYQLYRSNGSPIGLDLQFPLESRPQAAALQDGGFLIASEQNSGVESDGDADRRIAVQRFDEDGNPVGRLVYINAAGDQTLSDIETLADGRVAVTFRSETGNATNIFVERVQFLDPRDVVIEGDEGANAIYARLGDSELFGFEGNDTLVGMAGDDTIWGGAGADFLFGGGGDDSVRGGSGADSIDAGSGDDTLVGNGGADTLRGGLGADFMAGGGGNDVYVVDDLGDEVVERTNAGIETVVSTISYTLGATLENLTLGGSAGLSGTGNALNNAITGNAGGNFLNGGLGRDTLDGGAGVDRFIFSTTLGAGNVDVISRYSVADDVIYLDNAVFLGLADGALATGAFNTGSAATQTNDRVIYNASTGALLFDRDGLGGAAAIQFATIGVAVNAGEFLVI